METRPSAELSTDLCRLNGDVMAVKVEFTSEAQQFLADQKKMAEEQEKLRQGFRRTAKESADAERIARQAIRRGITDSERYREKVDAINKAFRDKRLTMTEYGQAIRQVRREYDEASSGADELSQAATANIGQMVAGYLSVSTAIAGVRSLLAQVNEEQQTALQEQRAATPSSGLLGTLGDGEALRQQAREIFAAGATGTLDEANRLIFELESVGLQQSRRLFESIGQAQLVQNIQSLPSQVQQFRESFETSGSAESVLSKLLKAQEAANANLESLTRASAIAAPSATLQGFSDSETLAILAQLSRTQGIDRAATNTSSLFTSAARLGIEGTTTAELIAGIRDAADTKGGPIIDTLGSQEAVKAFVAIEQAQNEIAKTLQEIQSASGGTLIGERIRGNLQDTQIASELARRQAAAGREIEFANQFAQRASALDVLAQRAQENAANRGTVTRAIAGTQDTQLQFLNLLAEYIPGFGNVRDNALSEAAAASRRQGDEALAKSYEALLNIQGNTQKQTKPAIPTPEAN